MTRPPRPLSHDVCRASLLSIQQAANMLNVSASFLFGLLDAGEIEFRDVGAHSRVTASSLIEYKQRDDRRRRAAADELTQLGQNMGLM